MENVTMRKRLQRTTSETSIFTENNVFENIHNSTLLDTSSYSTQSVPQCDENSFVFELKVEVDRLKQKLESADKEIENLTIENNQLLRTLQEQKIQIELLKKISQDISFKKNPTLTPILATKRLTRIRMSVPRPSPIHYDKSVCLSMGNTPEKLLRKIDIENRTLITPNTKINNNINITNQRVINDQSIYPKCSTEPVVQHQSKQFYNTSQKKHQVIIIADNQGIGLRNVLQDLLGSRYSVTSFVKPNAMLANVAESMKNDILKLDKNDFVIFLGGVNDKNPYEFSFRFNVWLSSITNTNVIVGEIPYNKYLNVKKLNNQLKFLCSKYTNAIYVDLNYSVTVPRYGNFVRNMARLFLKEILHLCYKSRMENYQMYLMQKNQTCFNTIGTQTEPDLCNICNCLNTDTKKLNNINTDVLTSECNNNLVNLSCDNRNTNNLFRK